MKKLILGLLAAILMSAGLVAAAGTPAQADCGNPRYPACFNTSTGLTVTPTRNGPSKRTFNASVRAFGTDARPVGKFVFIFKRDGGEGVRAVRKVPFSSRVTLKRELAKGRWTVRVRFVARDGSIFENSRSNRVRFRVRR